MLSFPPRLLASAIRRGHPASGSCSARRTAAISASVIISVSLSEQSSSTASSHNNPMPLLHRRPCRTCPESWGQRRRISGSHDGRCYDACRRWCRTCNPCRSISVITHFTFTFTFGILNDGSGRISRHVVGMNQEAYDIRVADLDGDGDKDFLVAGRESNNVAIYLNPKTKRQHKHE